ncbi:MAG: restriction endonuclease [Candidatus Nanohalobium sp.]
MEINENEEIRNLESKIDTEGLDKEKCREQIKNYHREGRAIARILENIGRRMIVIDDYDPRIVYKMINNIYEHNMYEEIERDKLEEIAEDAYEDSLSQTFSKLKYEIGKPIFESPTHRTLREDNREKTLEKEKKYSEKIKSFHEKGNDYHYRVLERIGRRMIYPEDDYSSVRIYNFINCLSQSESFMNLEKRKVDEIAEEAGEENFEQVRKKILSEIKPTYNSKIEKLEELKQELDESELELYKERFEKISSDILDLRSEMESNGIRKKEEYDSKLEKIEKEVENYVETTDKERKLTREYLSQLEFEKKLSQAEYPIPERYKEEKEKILEDIERIKEKIRESKFSSRNTEKENIEKEIQKLRKETNQFAKMSKNSSYRFIDPFVDKYGRGSPEKRNKLLKTINSETKKDMSKEELESKLEDEVREKERDGLKSVFELANDNLNSKIKYFVKVFGKGNNRTLSRASEVLDIEKKELSQKVEKKFQDLREEKELYEFQSKLGLGTSQEIPDFRLKREEIENLRNSRYIEDLMRGNLKWQEIKNMSGHEFEGFLEELFDEMGYKAQQTKKSGDQGADIIAEKIGEKVAIQAKNTQAKVSNSAIQEVRAAIDHYNCNRGLVVSTSEYTQSAKDLAESNEIELWNKKNIMDKKRKYLDNNQLV